MTTAPRRHNRWDHLPVRTVYQRFNRSAAIKITSAVGSMSCAYVFALIALISLPSAIRSHSVIVIISWIAQTFLQLVLLAVIIVGQNITGEASDARAARTFDDAEEIKAAVAGLQDGMTQMRDDLHKTITAVSRRLA